MLRSSLPLGNVFGVDVRVHLSFPLLLLFALALSLTFTHGLARGFALWLTLCFAVFVREAARSVAAACNGLHLRAIYLLPVGGVMAFSSSDGAALSDTGRSSRTRWVTISGPIANFATGLLILMFSFALEPHLALFAQPWISLAHILRSNIWIQFLLGGVSLIPAMPSRQLLRSSNPTSPDSTDTPERKTGSTSPVISSISVIAIAMIVAGFLFPVFFWLSILGVFVLLYAQVSGRHSQASADVDAILVREVMLTEYTLVSSSDTLRNALDVTIHSLHDVFPVVRGNRLVGSIARQTIAERLLSDGDSYLQGAMNRSLALTEPREKLVDALRRASTAGSTDFIPVIEDNHMIGILTPQSLPRAVQQVKLLRPARPQPQP